MDTSDKGEGRQPPIFTTTSSFDRAFPIEDGQRILPLPNTKLNPHSSNDPILQASHDGDPGSQTTTHFSDIPAGVFQGTLTEQASDSDSQPVGEFVSKSRIGWTEAEVEALFEVWAHRNRHGVAAPVEARFTKITGTTRTVQQMSKKWLGLQGSQQRKGSSVPGNCQDLSPELQSKLVAIFAKYHRKMTTDEQRALQDEWFAETRLSGSFKDLLSLYASLTRPRGG